MLGDTGIAMIDTPDPLCLAAGLFDMATYTIIAATELLPARSSDVWARTEAIARALPGRLWRSQPSLLIVAALPAPPVCSGSTWFATTRRWCRSSSVTAGSRVIHSHGRLRLILDAIASTGCDGLDPIEPPPQGDMALAEVRARHGQQMVLFGNLEASDLEVNLPFERVCSQGAAVPWLKGRRARGGGFVLMSSSIPYGRVLPDLALRNYQIMIQEVERF